MLKFIKKLLQKDTVTYEEYDTVPNDAFEDSKCRIRISFMVPLPILKILKEQSDEMDISPYEYLNRILLEEARKVHNFNRINGKDVKVKLNIDEMLKLCKNSD